MTPTLTRFVRHLEPVIGASLQMTFDEGPPPLIAIPAKHPAVGGLTIYDDGDELTVQIGDKHHTHFSGFESNADTDVDRLEHAADRAAGFVADLLLERVCVTVDFIGDRCIGSSHFYLDTENTTSEMLRDTMIGLRGGNIRSERYLWSEPVQEPRTEPSDEREPE